LSRDEGQNAIKSIGQQHLTKKSHHRLGEACLVLGDTRVTPTSTQSKEQSTMAAQETSGGRPWEWTPPPAMNTLMETILHLPVINRAISGMILVIKFIGRKSGKRYSTPVGYHREGDTVTILTKRFRKWWHNFEDPAHVELRIAGQNRTGEATALTDVETIVPIIAETVRRQPREAEIYGIEMNDDGTPNMDSVRETAPKVVVIRVKLDPAA
jgi:hypothetical protein